ncbi:hypothetical protein F7725_022133 [Dissostichus mawsoni]|uniref:Uncharacterized protein n=1 Tax=Dissostichus mawsoni TaxID=36200 RepID=A0A7J5ZD37_DISMA|nr:hypothetical protein F7725_022133 [Dissostichus mawsoni]
MAHREPTIFPPMVTGHMSPYPTVVMETTAHQKASGMLEKPESGSSVSAKYTALEKRMTPMKRKKMRRPSLMLAWRRNKCSDHKGLPEDLQPLGVSGQLEDPEDPDQADDPQDGEAHGLLPVPLVVRQLQTQRDEVRYDGHDVDGVHDVPEERRFARARQGSNQQLEGEPDDAERFHDEERRLWKPRERLELRLEAQPRDVDEHALAAAVLVPRALLRVQSHSLIQVLPGTTVMVPQVPQRAAAPLLSSALLQRSSAAARELALLALCCPPPPLRSSPFRVLSLPRLSGLSHSQSPPRADPNTIHEALR